MLPPMFIDGRSLLMTAVELFPAQKMSRVNWQMYHWRCREWQVCGSTIVSVGSNYAWFVVWCFGLGEWSIKRCLSSLFSLLSSLSTAMIQVRMDDMIDQWSMKMCTGPGKSNSPALAVGTLPRCTDATFSLKAPKISTHHLRPKSQGKLWRAKGAGW